MNSTNQKNLNLSSNSSNPIIKMSGELVKTSPTRGSTIVVAVSGGVDSMSLLHMLINTGNYKLVVAHYDHGIRAESADDAAFVAAIAKDSGVSVEIGRGMLGVRASEEEARQFRYKFLEEVVRKHRAAKIVTAHHHDDEIETAIINILRGTGRKGLTPMRHNKTIWRPLLSTRRTDIEAYANHHNLKWREDTTNHEDRYLRNYIRRNIVPKIAANSLKFKELQVILDSAEITNNHVDKHIEELLKSMTSDKGLSRKMFIHLPHTVASEIIIAWLRKSGCPVLDRKRINVLSVKAKTGRNQSRHAVSQGVYMHITNTHLQLVKMGLI